MSRSQLKCVNCSMFRPGRAWDEHDLCPKCRTCTRRDPCLVCINFTPNQWLDIDTWLAGQRSKLQDKLDLLPNPSGSRTTGDRAQLGEEEEGEVLERGPVGAEEEGEKGKEREREGEREREKEREKMPPTVPATSGSVMTKGKGKDKGKAPAKRKVPKKKSGLAGTEKASQSGSQRNNPPERQVPRAPTSPTRAPSGAHSREPEAGGSLSNQSRSRSGDREPQPSRSPAGIPDRESRGRNPSRNPARRDRTRSRSRSPRRGTRRGWSPASDQSSDSSDDGYRRAKRRYRPHKQRHEEEPSWLAQLTGLLKPLLEREQQRAEAETEAGSQKAATTTTTVPEPPLEPEAVTLGEDTLDCRASVNLSGLEDNSDVPPEFDPLEEEFPGIFEEEEAPTAGGSLPPELTTRVAEIFRKHLGFEDTPEVTTKPTRVSKLTATGETSTRPKSTIPVDASCYDRFEAIADKKRWTAFPAKAERAIRVPDEAWKTLFKCPTIPQEAREKLRSEQGSSSSHIFKNPSQKKLEELLVDVDLAARSGMKFTSVLMLTVVLMRYHQQLPQDDTYVSRNEAGQLLLLLGPLVRLAFDQFARVAIRSVKARRENVISSIRWPSVEAKERMLALPSLGDDLFAGSFQQKLQEEVSRRETLAKSEFRSSERFRSRPHRLRESRPTRGGRGTSLRTPMRGTPRGRSRGTTSRPPRPWGTRGSGRSPATTRRDGDRSSTRPPFAARP
ncbi:uncharacterized protein [Apostichopus japonicus]|uniref:uncharacterized protein n=1 Tax=Stichopus japonicus TaxID=307972 RepID=UPI003AB804A3